jgi:ribosomal protein S18 acetylase RimI-like enzyme
MPPSPVVAAVSIRRAEPADAPALAAFAAACFRATYGPDADPAAGGGSLAADVAAYVDGCMDRAHFAADLVDASCATFVAEATERALVGYAQLRVPSPAPAGAAVDDVVEGVVDDVAAELARLYVAPAWQGRGIAPALLDAVQAEAARAGARVLWLAVYRRNARAVGFYRRRGFAVAGAATFRMGAEVQDDWVMRRPVQPAS